ncbi:MAG: ferritin family protein [Thermoplasmata archaeon]
MKFEELLKKAIDVEEESYKFYKEAEKLARYPNVLEILELLANEELSHKKLLENIEKGNEIKTEEYLDLKLSDHLIPSEKINENSTLQEVIRVAMSREKSEYEFYMKLIKDVSNKNIQDTINFIAKQELNHKAKLENIYEELFYKEF